MSVVNKVFVQHIYLIFFFFLLLKLILYLQGFNGLSGSIRITLDKSFFKSYPTGFVIVMAVFPFVASVFFMWLVRLRSANSNKDSLFLSCFLICGFVIAVILLTVTILDNTYHYGSLVHIITTVVVLIIILVPLGAGVLIEKSDKSDETNPSAKDHDCESLSESIRSL